MEAVTLSFELFAICVKVYGLLEEATDMQNSVRYLRMRVRMERDKLVDWAVLAGLSEDESTLSPGLLLNKHLVNDALQEIKLVLFDLAKLGGRYDFQPADVKESKSDDDDPSSAPSKKPSAVLRRRALTFIDQTRKFPKRIRWVSFDKEEFEKLLVKLGSLNQNMMFFFERHQRELHYRMQQNSYMNILQANNKLDDVFALMSSLSFVVTANTSAAAPADGVSAMMTAHTKRLVRLTRFKALNLAIGTDKSTSNGGAGDRDQQAVMANLGDAASSTSAQLWSDDLTDMAAVEQDGDGAAKPARSSARCQGEPVWVEWRYYQPVGEDEEPPAYMEDRISRLATLLRDGDKPAEFHLPPCPGYVHDMEHHRFGFVFKLNHANTKPAAGESADGGVPPPPPLRLSDLLATTPRLSLTKRVEIARSIATSIWYLHATNWLHKGLRSESIVLLPSGDGHDDPASSSSPPLQPFLTGFDYSRPAGEATTERPSGNRLHELYRHPNAQFDFPRDGKRGFQKIYDIYSLGVVLFELGVWSPIHEFLGLGTTKENGPKQDRIPWAAVKGAREKLLSRESMTLLEGEVGEVYAGAVQACLQVGLVGGGAAAGEGGLQDLGAGGPANCTQLDLGEAVVHCLHSIRV